MLQDLIRVMSLGSLISSLVCMCERGGLTGCSRYIMLVIRKKEGVEGGGGAWGCA